MGRPATVDIQMVNHPHICSVCRVGQETNSRDDNSKREYFLDTGIEFDWEGTVYICSLCFRDMVTKAPDSYTQKDMDSLVESTFKSVTDGERAIENLDMIIDYVESLGFDPKQVIIKALQFKLDGGFNGRESVNSGDVESDSSTVVSQPAVDGNDSVSAESDVSNNEPLLGIESRDSGKSLTISKLSIS